MTNTLNLPETHKPHFFDDPNTDRLLSMVLELSQEIAILRERLDTHERVSEAKGGFGPEDVEAYEPDDGATAARDAWRQSFLKRLMAPAKADYAEKGNRS